MWWPMKGNVCAKCPCVDDYELNCLLRLDFFPFPKWKISSKNNFLCKHNTVALLSFLLDSHHGHIMTKEGYLMVKKKKENICIQFEKDVLFWSPYVKKCASTNRDSYRFLWYLILDGLLMCWKIKEAHRWEDFTKNHFSSVW